MKTILFKDSNFFHKSNIYMWVHTSYNKTKNEINKTQFVWIGGPSIPTNDISENYKLELIKQTKNIHNKDKICHIIENELKKHKLQSQFYSKQNECSVILNALFCIQDISLLSQKNKNEFIFYIFIKFKSILETQYNIDFLNDINTSFDIIIVPELLYNFDTALIAMHRFCWEMEDKLKSRRIPNDIFPYGRIKLESESEKEFYVAELTRYIFSAKKEDSRITRFQYNISGLTFINNNKLQDWISTQALYYIKYGEYENFRTELFKSIKNITNIYHWVNLKTYNTQYSNTFFYFTAEAPSYPFTKYKVDTCGMDDKDEDSKKQDIFLHEIYLDNNVIYSVDNEMLYRPFYIKLIDNSNIKNKNIFSLLCNDSNYNNIKWSEHEINNCLQFHEIMKEWYSNSKVNFSYYSYPTELKKTYQNIKLFSKKIKISNKYNSKIKFEPSKIEIHTNKSIYPLSLYQIFDSINLHDGECPLMLLIRRNSKVVKNIDLDERTAYSLIRMKISTNYYENFSFDELKKYFTYCQGKQARATTYNISSQIINVLQTNNPYDTLQIIFPFKIDNNVINVFLDSNGVFEIDFKPVINIRSESQKGESLSCKIISEFINKNVNSLIEKINKINYDSSYIYKKMSDTEYDIPYNLELLPQLLKVNTFIKGNILFGEIYTKNKYINGKIIFNLKNIGDFTLKFIHTFPNLFYPISDSKHSDDISQIEKGGIDGVYFRSHYQQKII